MLGLRLNALTVVLLAVLAFLQYRLWFESGGISEMQQLKSSLLNQEQENANLKQQNEKLITQIRLLQSSQEATEARARNELGMVKKGEKFYQIISPSRK